MKLLSLILASAIAHPALSQASPCKGVTCLVIESESKGDPCATNVRVARQDPGGLSIGAYQMSARYGNAQALVNYMGIDMIGLDPEIHAEAYAARFTAICRMHPEYSLSEQTMFLLQEWPEWKRARNRYEALYGISEPIMALALSVVVTHGYEGSKSILDSLRGAVPPLTEVELAYEISNKRACNWNSRSGLRFKKGWASRANREYRATLKALGEPVRNLEVNCDG